MSGTNSSEVFAAALRDAEDRLRATGLSGRRAYAALCRHFAQRLQIPDNMWLDGPDAPAEARLDRIPLTAVSISSGWPTSASFRDFQGRAGSVLHPAAARGAHG